jgi:hypothetical protein
MTNPTDLHPREADETTAPVVLAYILGVVVAIAALIAWVFWFRGYA